MAAAWSRGWALICGIAVLSCGRTAKDGEAAAPATAGAAGAGESGPAPGCALDIAGLGGRHCGVYEDGSVWCWGRGIDGEADDAWADEPRRIEGITDAKRVVLGETHSCALTNAGKVLCWGFNDARQIDDSESPLIADPAEVAGFATPVRAVGLSRTETCVLDILSHVYCRGAGGGLRQVEVALAFDIPGPGTSVVDVHGRVFDPESGDAPSAQSELGTDNRSVTAPRTPSCLVKRSGSVWCTDYLFDNDDTPRVRVALGESVLQAGTGDLFMCALTDEDTVWCEGYNQVGQLGRGLTSTFEDGGVVQGLADARRLSVADWSACALRADGSVWCWGAYRSTEPRTGMPTRVSACAEQASLVPVLELAAPRSSAARLAAAARAQAEAVCECTWGSPAPQSCIDEEDFAPNLACLEALAPGDAYWSCLAERHWKQARCFAEGCAPGEPASCTSSERDCSSNAILQAISGYCSLRKCSDGSVFVAKGQLCDGKADCVDGSDELNCEPGKSDFDCGNEQRVPLGALCDATADCDNEADEVLCF